MKTNEDTLTPENEPKDNESTGEKENITKSNDEAQVLTTGYSETSTVKKKNPILKYIIIGLVAVLVLVIGILTVNSLGGNSKNKKIEKAFLDEGYNVECSSNCRIMVYSGSDWHMGISSSYYDGEKMLGMIYDGGDLQIVVSHYLDGEKISERYSSVFFEDEVILLYDLVTEKALQDNTLGVNFVENIEIVEDEFNQVLKDVGYTDKDVYEFLEWKAKQ